MINTRRPYDVELGLSILEGSSAKYFNRQSAVDICEALSKQIPYWKQKGYFGHWKKPTDDENLARALFTRMCTLLDRLFAKSRLKPSDIYINNYHE